MSPVKLEVETCSAIKRVKILAPGCLMEWENNRREEKSGMRAEYVKE